MYSLRRIIGTYLQKIKNILKGNETIHESKNKWDSLAQKNARYFIMSDYGENISEEDFRNSGHADVDTLVVQDEILQPFFGKILLEIGCGTGRLTEFIADHFAQVIGVDISSQMIEDGTKRLASKKNIIMYATDGVSYPLKDQSIDAAFSFIVFQHMPTPEIVRSNFEEISRVLKPGGVVKLQLRGIPTRKGTWFYGPSFRKKNVLQLIDGLQFQILKTDGENTKYFWVWLKRQ
ncbi:hypothetical protein COU75_01625 [Candidatus Peregrinibacteria bacterium CG10_big_fil_rev_8_21_14_0_10_42_8]|nr:MAG: hypothetical protein COU75_01625 [Candidatus Peregrinibacteria bacterium CG10_big_fil_rev_8_21_14_0_10_42_8]